MKKLFGRGLLALALVPGPALADPGKDESGKGRGGDKGLKEFWKQEEKFRARQENAFEERHKHEEKFHEKRHKHEEKAWEERRKEERHRERAAKQWEESEKHGRESYRHAGAAGRWAAPPYVLAPPQGHDHEAGSYGAPNYVEQSYGVPSYGRRGDGYESYGYDPAGYGRSGYRGRGGDGGGGDGYGEYDSAYRPNYVTPFLPPPDDDVDGVYTPYGFFEKFPQPGYEPQGGCGPRPYGHGQIGPYRFEVQKGD